MRLLRICSLFRRLRRVFVHTYSRASCSWFGPRVSRDVSSAFTYVVVVFAPNAGRPKVFWVLLDFCTASSVLHAIVLCAARALFLCCITCSLLRCLHDGACSLKTSQRPGVEWFVWWSLPPVCMKVTVGAENIVPSLKSLPGWRPGVAFIMICVPTSCPCYCSCGDHLSL